MPRQPDRVGIPPRTVPRPGGRQPRTGNDGRRPKLEPHLSWLLRLQGDGKLRPIKDLETTRLEAVEQKIRAVLRQLRIAKTPSEIQKLQLELAERRKELFAPLTAAIHFPDDKRSLASRQTGITEPFLSGLVLLTRPERRLLEAIDPGIRVRTGAGKVFTVFVPLRLVPKLEASPFVRYVELSRPLFPNLGVATALAGLSPTRTGNDAGAGVVVGVIDDYLDVYHPDFSTAAGTRVLFLWDQTGDPALAGRSGPPLDPVLPGFMLQLGRTTTYGVEYDTAAIDLELTNGKANPALKYKTVLHVPEGSHGTAVTGCAAGNGRAWETYLASLSADRRTLEQPQLKGAAPEADIIFVRFGTIDGTTILGDSAYILDAFSYIFARAKQAGKNCVVNLSYSDNQGPHDGTSLGEQALDGFLTESKRAITLSAGNSTGTKHHAKGTVPANASVDVQFGSIAIGTQQPVNADAIEIWTPKGTPLHASLTGPVGVVMVPAAAPDIVPGPAVEQTFDGVKTTSTCAQDLRNLDNRILILFLPTAGQAIPQGKWTLRLTNDTATAIPFDAWIDRNNGDLLTWSTLALADAGDKATTLGVPATAKGPITVGAYQKAAKVILRESGLGPTRVDHGTFKPDLAAVGESILAPYPTNIPMGNPYPYKSESGTSVSAPLVAGACAILFNTKGTALGMTLTCDGLRTILTTKAGTSMPATLVSPDVGFGHGPLTM